MDIKEISTYEQNKNTFSTDNINPRIDDIVDDLYIIAWHCNIVKFPNKCRFARIDVAIHNYRFNIALSFANKHGYCNIDKYITDKKLNKLNHELCCASVKGDLEKVIQLIVNGADHFDTCLEMSYLYKQVDIVRFIRRNRPNDFYRYINNIIETHDLFLYLGLLSMANDCEEDRIDPDEALRISCINGYTNIAIVMAFGATDLNEGIALAQSHNHLKLANYLRCLKLPDS